MAINQTSAHSDTKIDAIKMAKTLHNKVVARQEMKDILKGEGIAARQRVREEEEFNDMTLEEQVQMVKLSEDPVLNFELHKLNQEIGATVGRKRPLNLEKWMKLKQWEMERGNAKTGDIGPMPDRLQRRDEKIDQRNRSRWQRLCRC